MASPCGFGVYGPGGGRASEFLERERPAGGETGRASGSTARAPAGRYREETADGNREENLRIMQSHASARGVSPADIRQASQLLRRLRAGAQPCVLPPAWPPRAAPAPG